MAGVDRQTAVQGGAVMGLLLAAEERPVEVRMCCHGHRDAKQTEDKQPPAGPMAPHGEQAGIGLCAGSCRHHKEAPSGGPRSYRTATSSKGRQRTATTESNNGIKCGQAAEQKCPAHDAGGG